MTDKRENGDNVEALIVGHFEGSLTREKEKELADMLSASADVRDVFNSHMRLEGRLHSLGRDGFLRNPADESQIEDDELLFQPAVATSDSDGPRRGSRLSSLRKVVLASTVVMILLAVWVLRPSTVSASSVLQEAQDAAAELIDRTYSVTLSGVGDNSGPRWLTVDLGGRGRFVVRPVDGGYVMGSDGIEYWMARESGPVWVTRDFRTLTPGLQRKIPNRRLVELITATNEPLLMDMSALLALIERRYDVKLTGSSHDSEHHVRATLERGRRNGPAIIEFTADAESGVVLNATLIWSADRKTHFELSESNPRSADWYHHSEHASGKEVRQITSAK